MELHDLLPVFIYLNLALVLSHAASPPEVYWKSMLPFTPMPKSIKQILPAGQNNYVTADGKNNIPINPLAGQKNYGTHNVPVNPLAGQKNYGTGNKRYDTAEGKHNIPINPLAGQKNYGTAEGKHNVPVNPLAGQKNYGTADGKHNVPVNPLASQKNYGHGNKRYDTAEGKHNIPVNPLAGQKNYVQSNYRRGNKRYDTAEGKHNIPVNPLAGQKNYGHGNKRDAIAELQLQKEHMFFLENELHPGSMLDFAFINITNTVTFWPRQVVKSMPFSKNKVPEILQKFSIKPKSKEAEIIENTIMECEEPAMKGEEKFCATSLESMVDFGISKLGKYVKVISTEAEKETMLQKYQVTTEAKFEGDKDVVCHKENYPYAVYYCHKLHATVVYSVGLKGIADGTKVMAVAVCHRDTSNWNPMHLAFQELKVKPGTHSICHFLAEDTVVWVSN